MRSDRASLGVSRPATSSKRSRITPIGSWAWSSPPDGKHLLTCSRDKTAKVWDLAAKESVLTFPDHQNPVFGVGVKADSKAGFSVGTDKQLRMWNATGEGKQIKVLGNHGDDILKLVQHPKEPVMVTTSADKTVKVWNPETGANTKTLSGLNDHVFAAAISPDGKQVAAGGYDGEVQIWTVADGKVVKTFNASPGYVPPRHLPEVEEEIGLLLRMKTRSAAALARLDCGRFSCRSGRLRPRRPADPVAALLQVPRPGRQGAQGRLRLDLRASAIAKTRSGEIPIVPGKPDESELVRRIESDDETEMMPPPADEEAAHRRPEGDPQALDRRGGRVQGPLGVPAPKSGRVAGRPPARLAEEPHRLLRPGPAGSRGAEAVPGGGQVHARPPRLPRPDRPAADTGGGRRIRQRQFAGRVRESSSIGCSRSPHYGERWARRWLDLARYADTNGYEKDRPRSIWPYRDWVIKALNDDLPFDQFTIEQLAGDMLPGATLDQRIATGFHRNTMLNEEGGIDPLEFRWHAVNDRVATTGTVWLGLTLNCCQCHTHKFDPISQQEYYQLSAFLNNCDEPTIDVPSADDRRPPGGNRKADRGPGGGTCRSTSRPTRSRQPDDSRSADELRRVYLEARFHAWLQVERTKAMNWTTLKPVAAKGNIPLLTVEADGSVFVSGDQSKRDVYDLTFRTDLKNITAIRIEALPDERLPNRGPGPRQLRRAVRRLLPLRGDAHERRQAAAHRDTSRPTSTTGKNKPEHAVDGEPLTGWSINGGQGRAHAIVFNLAEPIKKARQARTVDAVREVLRRRAGQVPRLGDDRDNKKAEARGVPDRPAAAHSQGAGPAHERPIETRSAEPFPRPGAGTESRNATRSRSSATTCRSTRRLWSWRSGRHITRGRRSFTSAASSPSRPTTVQPGVPAFLPPLPKGAPADRLAFARWLVSAGQPAHGPRDREPGLGRVLRPRNRPHDRGLRLPGRTADASGTARLAGGRVRQVRLVDEEAAQADRHVRDVSAVVAGDADAAGEGPEERAACPAARACGSRPRWSATTR